MTIWKSKKDLESSIKELLDNIEYRDTRIKYLEKEVQRLKSERFKDEELNRMLVAMTEAKEDLLRGFPISKEAEEKIKKFIDAHTNRNMRISDFFKYEFCPTPLGTVGTIIAHNGDKLVFQEIE